MSPPISDIERLVQALRAGEVHLVDGPAPERTTEWTTGFLFRWASPWMGSHWSRGNKRLCVNFLPFCTFWVCRPGGFVPRD